MPAGKWPQLRRQRQRQEFLLHPLLTGTVRAAGPHLPQLAMLPKPVGRQPQPHRQRLRRGLLLHPLTKVERAAGSSHPSSPETRPKPVRRLTWQKLTHPLTRAERAVWHLSPLAVMCRQGRQTICLSCPRHPPRVSGASLVRPRRVNLSTTSVILLSVCLSGMP